MTLFLITILVALVMGAAAYLFVFALMGWWSL